MRERPALYLKSVTANFMNHFVIAPLIFALPLRHYTGHIYECVADPGATVVFSWWTNLFGFDYCGSADEAGSIMTGTIARSLGLLLVQALGYYLVHKQMHRPGWYWTHRFHHQFDKIIVPVTANAVSPAEYVLAYMFPIFAGTILLRPDLSGLFAASYLVSLNNVLIHTPALHGVSKLLPEWLVSTEKHFDHHAKRTIHYAAPTLDVDWFAHKLCGT
jgi:sterol desaturase/sphingolipid hydroxylase (fatty acid hydroxylase superfamily)